MATHVILDGTKPEDRDQLRDELTGPLRAQGTRPPDEANAPAWWHGDEEAYEATAAALGRLKIRRR